MIETDLPRYQSSHLQVLRTTKLYVLAQYLQLGPGEFCTDYSFYAIFSFNQNTVK